MEMDLDTLKRRFFNSRQRIFLFHLPSYSGLLSNDPAFMARHLPIEAIIENWKVVLQQQSRDPAFDKSYAINRWMTLLSEDVWSEGSASLARYKENQNPETKREGGFSFRANLLASALSGAPGSIFALTSPTDLIPYQEQFNIIVEKEWRERWLEELLAASWKHLDSELSNPVGKKRLHSFSKMLAFKDYEPLHKIHSCEVRSFSAWCALISNTECPHIMDIDRAKFNTWKILFQDAVPPFYLFLESWRNQHRIQNERSSREMDISSDWSFPLES